MRQKRALSYLPPASATPALDARRALRLCLVCATALPASALCAAPDSSPGPARRAGRPRLAAQRRGIKDVQSLSHSCIAASFCRLHGRKMWTKKRQRSNRRPRAHPDDAGRDIHHLTATAPQRGSVEDARAFGPLSSGQHRIPPAPRGRHGQRTAQVKPATRLAQSHCVEL